MPEKEEHQKSILQELRKIAAHFFLGGGSLAFLFTVVFGRYAGLKSFIVDWMFNGTIWVTLGLGNGYIVDWLDKKMPWLNAPISRTLVSLLVTIAYSVLVAFIVYVGFTFFMYGRNPLETIQDVDESFIISVVTITMLISLFLHGRGFFLSWKSAFEEAEENKRAALSARYESLKNQVNPHFLFNSFNVLSSLVYKDQDLAAQFIKQLTRVYRYVLETQDSELVPLSKEMEVLDAYLFLLKIRFQDALVVENKIEEKADMAILPLTLQMLTENAIKHNIASKKDPLHLEFFIADEEYICIKNNLQPRSDNPDSLGIGLPNIQARYEYIGGKAMNIVETDSHFCVYIPIIRLNEL